MDDSGDYEQMELGLLYTVEPDTTHTDLLATWTQQHSSKTERMGNLTLKTCGCGGGDGDDTAIQAGNPSIYRILYDFWFHHSVTIHT